MRHGVDFLCGYTETNNGLETRHVSDQAGAEADAPAGAEAPTDARLKRLGVGALSAKAVRSGGFQGGRVDLDLDARLRWIRRSHRKFVKIAAALWMKSTRQLDGNTRRRRSLQSRENTSQVKGPSRAKSLAHCTRDGCVSEALHARRATPHIGADTTSKKKKKKQ